jgi:hypothetical protein
MSITMVRISRNWSPIIGRMNQNIGIDISFEYNLELDGRVNTFRLRFLSENISNKRQIVKIFCIIKIETNPVVSICSE